MFSCSFQMIWSSECSEGATKKTLQQMTKGNSLPLAKGNDVDLHAENSTKAGPSGSNFQFEKNRIRNQLCPKQHTFEL